MQLNIRSNTKRISYPDCQRGVGMIEVLITLFILSIGLLGVASLQFVASKSNADALNRTQAVLVAQQFSERLRANAVSSTQTDGFVVDNEYFNQGHYNFDNLSCVSGNTPYACFCETHPADVPNCQTGECDSQQFAQFDAYQMSCAAVKNNPNVELLLTCDDKLVSDTDLCSAGSIHNVVIKWPVKNWQNNNRVANTNCNVLTTDQFDCVVVEVAL